MKDKNLIIVLSITLFIACHSTSNKVMDWNDFNGLWVSTQGSYFPDTVLILIEDETTGLFAEKRFVELNAEGQWELDLFGWSSFEIDTTSDHITFKNISFHQFCGVDIEHSDEKMDVISFSKDELILQVFGQCQSLKKIRYTN
ncbi:hypothetical protein [Flammeovirga sp. SJP92]|uniref:hypothetical protein n=1 Tax=Flammeovirga sp. SJP92 TaxID=1775430 RepID=UPI0007886734|nr:hypothetical protein [Flammeovirga sp. SJP92]KXX69797.1 hypothetical protein AVL50_12980 [Flammeovirga sp. SJP92]